MFCSVLPIDWYRSSETEERWPHFVGQHDGQTGVQLAVELGPTGRRSEVRDEVKRLWESGIIVGGIVGDEVIGCAALMLDDSFAPAFASADGLPGQRRRTQILPALCGMR